MKNQFFEYNTNEVKLIQRRYNINQFFFQFKHEHLASEINTFNLQTNIYH